MPLLHIPPKQTRTRGNSVFGYRDKMVTVSRHWWHVIVRAGLGHFVARGDMAKGTDQSQPSCIWLYETPGPTGTSPLPFQQNNPFAALSLYPKSAAYLNLLNGRPVLAYHPLVP